MADTALNDNEITEYFDSIEKVECVAKNVAQLLKKSAYCVLFTGAGLSTSAGIADFRGPNGVWTLEAKGVEYEPENHFLLPTTGHMAIKKLVDEGLVKFIVSQNVDGLHIKSGIPNEKLAELHGNTDKEYCKYCGKVYYRSFRTCDDNDDNHKTSRKCTKCKKYLFDSIVDFGEDLPEADLMNSETHSKLCDLAIVFGTSLRVTPACNLPLMMRNDGKLVICNLQKTPLDNKTDDGLVVHTKCDQLIELIMKELNLDIPDFILKFKLAISIKKQNTKTSSKNNKKYVKKLKINCSTINLNDLLSSLIVNDEFGNEYVLLPNSPTGICLKDNHDDDDKKLQQSTTNQLILKLDFNFLQPFSSYIKITSACKIIDIQLNTTKQYIEYKIENNEK